MKKYLYLLLIGVVLFSACNSPKKPAVEPESTAKSTDSVVQSPVPVDVKLLDGYFLKNTHKPTDSVELIVFNDSKDFDAFFGMAKTMTNTIVRPDFNTQIVAALVVQETPFKTEIKVDKVEMLGEQVTAYVTITKGEKQTYTTTPVVLSAFSKEAAGKQLKVVINGVPNDKLTQTL